ncbi:hypothetical protein D9Q98_001500 [Chlorella vulgaris]|uniref:Pectin acetylesterase n=1 Tax=Chlorella vulgaris TaxID=3077 RepID=A0A9D4Z2R5_CHLVU|nr:hypothetical protein D9Q98_001500 [Chlorella vulgaris]
MRKGRATNRMSGGRLLAVAVAVAVASALPVAWAADTTSGTSPGPTVVSDQDGGRTWYHEVPSEPMGTLLMLHRCGRNAEDFWPPSSVCPQCIGMPEGVSISRQGLARGYALLAINSLNRTLGSGGRCFSWADDAFAVRDIVAGFQKKQGLEKLPLYITGCSSGGSVALRIPSIMKVDGLMPVAIGLDLQAFPPSNPWPENHTYPPTAYIHFSRDKTISAQVAAMLEFSANASLPTAEVKEVPAAIDPAFFSRRDAMISEELSRALYTALKEDLQVLDDSDFLKENWQQLVSQTQLQEKLRSVLASGGAVAASSLDGGDGGGGAAAEVVQLPADRLMDLVNHVQEEVAVAWAEHTNLGDYTTAVLMWLEGGGKGDFAQLAKAHRVTEPAALAAPGIRNDNVPSSAVAPPGLPPPAPSNAARRGRWAAATAAVAAAALALVLL